MADLRDRIYHRRSPVISKRPELIDIDDGELAINYNADEPGLYFKDLAGDGTRKIRKIGPIHVGPTPPNTYAAAQGYPTELSNGECWVDTSGGEDFYILKVWNSSSSQWIEASRIYARTDLNLDQFVDGEDGDDFIHTDEIRLKINNKTALAGFSTADGDKLIINEDNEFANGVELNGKSFLITSEEVETISNNLVFKPHQGYIFTTDSVVGTSQTVFEYSTHGLFNGEKIYVFGTLIDGITPSPVPQGEYFIADSTINTFRLKTINGNYVNSTGNIHISYSPEIIVDRDRNVIQAGNFGIKSVDDIIEYTNGSGQIAEKTWDVFHNPTNGNVRVFARVGNEVNQIETSLLSIDVKSAELSDTILAGDPVYYSGQDFANRLAKVSKAKSSDNTKMRAIGVALKNISPGSRGVVVLLGEVGGFNTSNLPGALPNNTSNLGRVVYVGENGGLTFSQPNTSIGDISQQIGILIREDATDGAIMVNHPSSFVSLPSLPENYIWAGITNDIAIAHYLLPTTFQRTYDNLTDTWKIGLADNIEFGGYRFASDGENSSKIETFVDTTQVPFDSFSPFIVEKFSTSYRSAKYIVQVSGSSADGTDSMVYQVGEILIVHNETNAFVVEYGMVSTYLDERLGQFDAYIDTQSSEVVLTFQKFPLVVDNVELKTVRTSILV
jgi:hypothetical protein